MSFSKVTGYKVKIYKELLELNNLTRTSHFTQKVTQNGSLT